VIVDEFSLADERRAAYSGDRTLALMLSLVCLTLLAVTAFGIVGLTSYWVSQRRRQIGIRRALGATRLAIMQHFQAENLLITTGGIAAGAALTVAGNLWIVRRFAMGRLPYDYLLIGIAALLLLGQLAVLWPALRAASVPPAVATRNV
jgi:putative ABC transport system permease protein